MNSLNDNTLLIIAGRHSYLSKPNFSFVVMNTIPTKIMYSI